jgi:hypothetical protein
MMTFDIFALNSHCVLAGDTTNVTKSCSYDELH